MAEDKHRTKYYENFQKKHIDGLQHVKATEALKYALDIRKFEIELYWKRTTYFWAIIAAIFTGFGVSSNADMHFLQTLLGGLGLVFSLGWYLANRGSKHWQQNWEQHVDMLEDPVIGPLYKTVFSEIPRKDKEALDFLTTSAPYSVSKINQMISAYVTLIWLIILAQLIFEEIAAHTLPANENLCQLDRFCSLLLDLSFLKQFVIPIAVLLLPLVMCWHLIKKAHSPSKGGEKQAVAMTIRSTKKPTSNIL